MDPYDPAIAKLVLDQANSYFAQAKQLSNGNAKANFGLAITTAATTAQSLIDKYQAIFNEEDASSQAESLKNIANSLTVWNIGDTISGDGSQLDSFVTSLSSPDGPILGAAASDDSQLVLDMKADLINIVLPMFNTIIGYINLAEQDASFSTFSFDIGAVGSEDYKIIDAGDIYLFHSGLLLAKSYLAIPAAYNVDAGSYNFHLDTDERDADHDRILTPTELLPASPCLTLQDASKITGMVADIKTACDKAILGINATLAETKDNYDLIPWHTADSGITQAKLLSYKSTAQNLKNACDGPTVVTFISHTDGATGSVKLNLKAWATTPPEDLKVFFPRLYPEKEEYYPGDGIGKINWGTRSTSFADPTFGGLLPDYTAANLDMSEFFTQWSQLIGVYTQPADTTMFAPVNTNIRSSFTGNSYAHGTYAVRLERETSPGVWSVVPMTFVSGGEFPPPVGGGPDGVDVTYKPNAA